MILLLHAVQPEIADVFCFSKCYILFEKLEWLELGYVHSWPLRGADGSGLIEEQIGLVGF